MLIVSCAVFANLPVSYIVLKMGAEPTATMIVSIAISVICLFIRAKLLNEMIGFPFMRYVLLVFKVMIVSVFLFLLIRYFVYDQGSSIIGFICQSILIALVNIFLYSFVLDKSDRVYVFEILKKKLRL